MSTGYPNYTDAELRLKTKTDIGLSISNSFGIVGEKHLNKRRKKLSEAVDQLGLEISFDNQ